MVQPHDAFKPILRSNQWTIQTPKGAQEKTHCEDIVIKKIKSIVSAVPNTQKITSIQLQGNRLTMKTEGTSAEKRSQEFQIDPKECIFTLLRQKGPIWIERNE